MSHSNETFTNELFPNELFPNDETQILDLLNSHYPMHFDQIEFVRDSGCMAYTFYTSDAKYFLRITKPAFLDTAIKSLDIHLFLQKEDFSVPKILFTKENSPSIKVTKDQNSYFYILYEFIDGSEVNPEKDAKSLGAFVGKLHHTMKHYPGQLVKRDKSYYIDRYIQILHTKNYPKIDAFAQYGEALWERVKDLPYGYCHGDLYTGNILKSTNGQLYLLDLDTFCEGFIMYDPALICNRTDYFNYKENGYSETEKVYNEFLSEYIKYNSLNNEHLHCIYDLLVLYHFALQATIIELFGLDCVDEAFFDNQLDWLNKWQAQCQSNL